MARQESNVPSGPNRHAVHEPEPETPIVAYLGPISSYTHQAALQCFDSDRYDYKPATTISDVFEAVQSGEAALGVVPFENSTNGAVIFTLELLADRHSSFPDITVCGEAYLDVSHCLLGRQARRTSLADSPDISGTSTGTATPTSSTPSPVKPRTAPLCSIKHIKRIYTHPQAFGQCENFLQSYLKGVERIDVSSTSRAAEMVKEDMSRESAAIASSLAAKVQNLDILARGIEDREDNTTRFFIIRKGVDGEAKETPNPTKSLISFTVDHRSPGALADVLDCFRRSKLNLTSINSRPTKVVPFQYIFFVEFEGSRLKDPDGRVEEALSCLEKHTQSWRWLGSWDDRLTKLRALKATAQHLHSLSIRQLHMSSKAVASVRQELRGILEVTQPQHKPRTAELNSQLSCAPIIYFDTFDMRSSTFFQISRRGFRAFYSIPKSPRPIRFYSTESLQQSLHKDLTSREPNIIFDYLSPTPSHLLNVSLADLLPESCYPPDFSKSDMSDLPFARLESLHEFDRALLPQGHHLVYFSPQVPGSELLPDGTDPLQSPGAPFVRRLWAGGSLVFNPLRKRHLQLDTTRATCIEKISDVSVKGTDGDEKVFVSIERRIGLAGHKYCDPLYSSGSEPREIFRRFVRGYLQIKDASQMGNLSMVETRNLVFMREKSPEAAKADAAKSGKILKPALAPDFAVSITPTKALLFRFSALTFNAHSIHLDPQYAREIEGHRNILVHGPLSLVLMLSVLRSQLKEGEMIMKFDYRNLAPLYAEEELKVCITKDAVKEDRYDVWIEGKEGGYAVKGSAVVGQTDATPFDRIDF